MPLRIIIVLDEDHGLRSLVLLFKIDSVFNFEFVEAELTLAGAYAKSLLHTRVHRVQLFGSQHGGALLEMLVQVFLALNVVKNSRHIELACRQLFRFLLLLHSFFIILDRAHDLFASQNC